MTHGRLISLLADVTAKVVIVAIVGTLAPSATAAETASVTQASDTFTTRSRKLMGTQFVISALARTSVQKEAIDAALDAVADAERRWSPWIAGSLVKSINEQAGKAAVVVDAGTLALIQRSLKLCKASKRAFDPTFFALSPLYDFRASPFKPPTAKTVAAVLPSVDCRRLVVDAKKSTVQLERVGMQLHLGGNAKGTGLDIAASILRKAGITRFYVNGGGDLVSSGKGPAGAWRVGLQHPRQARGELMGAVYVTDGAVATSGDYERFAMVGDTRFHHIIDPRNGLPATGCMSATVIVPSQPHAGELADSLATVLCVAGPRLGFRLLKLAKGAQAAVLTRDGRLHRTKVFNGKFNLAAPAPSHAQKP